MAAKKHSAARNDYDKELKRIKSFIRRAEKRGFRFDKSILPPRPARYTRKQVEILKEITAATLYRNATYLSESGKVISGGAGRAEERRRSARKAAVTRQKKKAPERRVASASNLVLASVEALINQYPTAVALSLQRNLDREISRYGRDAVAKALATAPQDMVQMVQDIIFYQTGGKEDNARAIRTFFEIIKGAMLSKEEAEEAERLSWSMMDGNGYED